MTVDRVLLPLLCLFAAGNSYAQTSHREDSTASTVRHTLQRGETLELLAERNKTTVEAIKAVNPDMEEVLTGMEVLLPAAKTASVAATVSTAATQDSLISASLDAVIYAHDLLSAREYKKARKAFTTYIERFPSMVSYEHYFYRAVCSYNIGKYRAAEEDLLTAYNDSECKGKIRESVSELLEKARQHREEIHQKNANIFGGLLQVAAGTTMAVMQAKAASKQQKSSSSGGSSSYSSDNDSEDTGGGISSTKSKQRTCGLCGGKGYTAEYRPGFGIEKYVHCDDCGEVREGHYHKTCRCQK